MPEKMLSLPQLLDIKKLDVFFREEKVGTLAETKNGTVACQYAPRWQTHGFSLSPFSLPLSNKLGLLNLLARMTNPIKTKPNTNTASLRCRIQD